MGCATAVRGRRHGGTFWLFSELQARGIRAIQASVQVPVHAAVLGQEVLQEVLLRLGAVLGLPLSLRSAQAGSTGDGQAGSMGDGQAGSTGDGHVCVAIGIV